MFVFLLLLRISHRILMKNHCMTNSTHTINYIIKATQIYTICYDIPQLPLLLEYRSVYTTQYIIAKALHHVFPLLTGW